MTSEIRGEDPSGAGSVVIWDRTVDFGWSGGAVRTVARIEGDVLYHEVSVRHPVQPEWIEIDLRVADQ